MRHRSLLLFAALPWAIVAAVALLVPSPPVAIAQSGGASGPIPNGVVTTYFPDMPKGPYRTGINSADSAQITSSILLTVPAIATKGRQTICVSPRFSLSGQTVGLFLVKSFLPGNGTETIAGISAITTASEGALLRQDDSGKYICGDVLFDTGGAPYVRVLVEGAPSSGTVDLWTYKQ